MLALNTQFTELLKVFFVFSRNLFIGIYLNRKNNVITGQMNKANPEYSEMCICINVYARCL